MINYTSSLLFFFPEITSHLISWPLFSTLDSTVPMPWLHTEFLTSASFLSQFDKKCFLPFLPLLMACYLLCSLCFPCLLKGLFRNVSLCETYSIESLFAWFTLTGNSLPISTVDSQNTEIKIDWWGKIKEWRYLYTFIIHIFIKSKLFRKENIISKNENNIYWKF